MHFEAGLTRAARTLYDCHKPFDILTHEKKKGKKKKEKKVFITLFGVKVLQDPLPPPLLFIIIII